VRNPRSGCGRKDIWRRACWQLGTCVAKLGGQMQMLWFGKVGWASVGKVGQIGQFSGAVGGAHTGR